MLKASELRIGNCVHKIDAVSDGTEIKYSNRLHIISACDIYHIAEDGDPTNHPISLTVEWMAKLGLAWNATDKRYYIQIGNTLYLEFDVDFDCFIAPESWAGSCPWSNIKNVHQLQNLYFALTGEELKIKP